MDERGADNKTIPLSHRGVVKCLKERMHSLHSRASPLLIYPPRPSVARLLRTHKALQPTEPHRLAGEWKAWAASGIGRSISTRQQRENDPRTRNGDVRCPRGPDSWCRREVESLQGSATVSQRRRRPLMSTRADGLRLAFLRRSDEDASLCRAEGSAPSSAPSMFPCHGMPEPHAWDAAAARSFGKPC